MEEDTRGEAPPAPSWESRTEKQLDAETFHIWMPRPLLRSILWQPEPPVSRDASSGSYEVFLTQAALRAAHEHVWFAEEGVEPFGFLVGDLCEDPETNRRYVIISGAVPCRLSFDEEGDQQISAEAEVTLQLEVDRTRGYLVGWYHRHWQGPPVLTAADVVTHQDMFPEPWHTALLFVTDLEEPTGALFRRSTHGFEGTSPLPFFEMVSNESLMAKGVRRSWVDWKNVSTEDHILQETPDRPDVLIPPMSETDVELAPDTGLLAEPDLEPPVDEDLELEAVPEAVDEEVAPPTDEDQELLPEVDLDLGAEIELEPAAEIDLEPDAEIGPDLGAGADLEPPVDEDLEPEADEEIESEAVSELVEEPEPEPIEEPEPEVVDLDVEPMPGLSSSPLPEPVEAGGRFETEVPLDEGPDSVIDAVESPPDELAPESPVEAAAEPAMEAPIGGEDLPEGMLAALKEVLAEVTEADLARTTEIREAAETQERPEIDESLLAPAEIAPGGPLVPEDAELAPAELDRISDRVETMESEAAPEPPPPAGGVQPKPRTPIPWKRYGPIGLAVLLVIAIGGSLLTITMRPDAGDTAGESDAVTQPPPAALSNEQQDDAGVDDVAEAGPTGQPTAQDPATVPVEQDVPGVALPDQQPEVTPEQFEILRDGLLASISSFYGRAVARDNGQATCADLQAAFVTVEDTWITYNVEGKARLGGRLIGDDAVRDERLYAGVQDVEREFDRSGCERP